MSDQPIYLFKGARRPLYRKENLHLLAEERGAIVEVAWNRSWVSPGLWDDGAIARGRRVVFLLTDRPYDRFVPIRAGEVVSAEWDDLMLRLRVSLRNHIGLPDDVDVPHFTRLVRGAAGGHCPGDKFVGPKRDGVELVPFYDEREEEGWRRAVDGVLVMSAASEDDAYRRSVFFRPVGLRVGDDELARARRVPLDPGTRATLVLQFHNPHLDDDAIAGHTLRALAPDDALRVTAPEAFPREGTVDVEIEALGGEAQLTLQVRPASGQHTHVVERFRTRVDGAGEEGRAVAGRVGGAREAAEVHVVHHDDRRDELMGVYDLVLRNARFDPGDRIDVFDRFATLLPGEQRIREDWALFCLEQADDAGALRILETLDPERIERDDARFALFRLRVHGDDEHPAHRVEALGLADESRFPRLLDELADLSPRVLARIVPELVDQLPADQVRDLIARVGDRLESPDALARTAQLYYLSTGDGDRAYRWLLDRYHHLRLADAATEDAILDLAGTRTRQDDDPELDHIAAHRVANLVDHGDLQAARQQLRAAGGVLGDAERRRLYGRIADRLADRHRWDEAAAVLVELAWDDLNRGHVSDATDAATRARGLWAPTGDEPPDWLRDCLGQVEAAWADCETLQDWRTTEDERRRHILRERFLNRRILIAGGQRRGEWVAYIQDLTGAEVDWCRAYRDETDDLEAFAQRLENGSYDLVVHYLQKTGHGTAEVLKPAAEKGGVAWVDATSAGRRGVVGAVWSIADDTVAAARPV